MLSERQEQIIEESIKLIDKKGIQGLTIKNLSKAIEISEPGIYRHFESKSSILLTILNNLKQSTEHLSSELKNKNISSLEKLEVIFDHYFKRFTKTPAIVSVIFAEEIFKNEKVLSEKVLEIISLNQKIMMCIIQSGQESGEIRSDIDKNNLAILIIGSLRMIVKKWELSRYSFNLKKQGESLYGSIKLLIKNEN